jgi:hypothetical protein
MALVKFKREFEFVPVERQVQQKWKRVVTGVVADPENVDSEKRKILPEVIEKMAWGFLENSRNFGVFHQKDKNGNPVVLNDKIKVVESWVTQEKIIRNGVTIPKGAWVITVRIHDDKIWDMIVKGILKGFSFEAKVKMRKLKAA